MVRIDALRTELFGPCSADLAPGTRCRVMVNTPLHAALFIETLVGLKAPLSGGVTLMGQDPHALPSRDSLALVSNVGIVWRHGGIISNLKAWENIVLPLVYHRGAVPPDAAERVRAIYARLGHSEEDATRMLAMPPSRLPRQEQMTVGLARAILMEPHVIIYDSIFEDMGPGERAGLAAIIDEFHRAVPGRITLYVTEDAPLAGMVEADVELRLA